MCVWMAVSTWCIDTRLPNLLDLLSRAQLKGVDDDENDDVQKGRWKKREKKIYWIEN